MTIVQIDVVDAEPLQTLFARRFHILRLVANLSCSIWVQNIGEFGGEEDLYLSLSICITCRASLSNARIPDHACLFA